MTRFGQVAALLLSAAVSLAPAYARAADDQLNLNAASEQELEKLPGIGPAVARRIVDFREQNGAFDSLDELAQVKGISQATIEKIRAYVFVGPQPGARAQAQQPPAAPVRAVAPVAEAQPEEQAGDAATHAQVAKLLARYKNEPGVRDVQEAAMRYAEVHPEIMQSWRSRSRIAALAPQMRAEYRYVTNDDLRVRQGGADGSDYQQTDLGYEHRPLARAQWDLDRLIFNPDELRVSNEIVDLVRLRESVLDQVTKVYYERRRLQVDLDLTPPKDIAGRVRKELRLQELVADLDSLTGGFFSKKLGERGLDPY